MKRKPGRSKFSATMAVLLLAASASVLGAESTRSLIRDGNKAYSDGDYVDAEVQYRKALEKEGGLAEGSYNLGGALYKQEMFEGAARVLDEAILETKVKDVRAKSYFNQGNALFKQQRYQESIDSYINSLKLEPNDMDAKYNLLYALKKLREEEQQNSSQDQSSGEEEKERENNQQDQEEQSDNQDQEKSSTKDESGEEERQESQRDDRQEMPRGPEEEQMSRAEAERILQALKENEMEVQKKLMAKQTGRVRVEKDW